MPTAASQLAERYAERITSGEITEGTVLTPADVAREYHISDTTARTVLRLLAAHGLARLSPKTGARVSPGGQVPSAQHRARHVTGGGNRILGANEHSEIIEVEWRVPPEWVRLALDTAPDEEVLQRLRLTIRDTDGSTPSLPISASISYKPRWQVDALPALTRRERMPSGGMGELLAARGQSGGHGWDDVRAAFAPEHIAKLLRMDPKTPVLEVHNVWLMNDGTPLEVGCYWVPSDKHVRFTYPFGGAPTSAPEN